MLYFGTPLPLRGGFPPKIRSHICANDNLFAIKTCFYAGINNFSVKKLAHSKFLLYLCREIGKYGRFTLI